MVLRSKFLSRRGDKDGHKRNNSHEAHGLDAVLSVFRPSKQVVPDAPNTEQEDKAEKAAKAAKAEKIAEIKRQIDEKNLDLKDIQDNHIVYALDSKITSGDPDKAIDLLILQKRSFGGYLVSYDSSVHMLGAENRDGISCYLDSLLFAMFSSIDSYDAMLTCEFPEGPARTLAAYLRLWVNLLRTGRVIETGLTEHIQNQLALCGWDDAKLIQQQDTSEAFAHITEFLNLPLLRLKVDLFHQGKNDDADHRLVEERLLNLAVPADTDGRGVRLEDCMEVYFNSEVVVQRVGVEDKASGPGSALNQTSSPISATCPDSPRTTMSILDEEGESSMTPTTENPVPGGNADESDGLQQLERRWTDAPGSRLASPLSFSHPRPHRSRTESIIQRVVVDERRKTLEAAADELFGKVNESKPVRKAVTIPALQFFRLIPWNATPGRQPNGEMRNNREMRRYLDKRPVVAVCLKRYFHDENGNIVRQNTPVDIPESLSLPYFVADEEDGCPLRSDDYKFVLQSVVCHRGNSLNSGHYIAFSRGAPKILTENRRHTTDPPPDYEQTQWVRFDDMGPERVTLVDNFDDAIKAEMPYLLFFQIVPAMDVCSATSTDCEDSEPPAYQDDAITLSRTNGKAPDYSELAHQTGNAFGPGPEIRFSTDSERPQRLSLADDERFLGTSRNSSRRGSVHYAEYVPSSRESSTHEESTANKLSRAAQMLRTPSKSRPTSQNGEGKMNSALSKLGGLVKANKDKGPARSRTTSGETDKTSLDITNFRNGVAAETTTVYEKSTENSNPLHNKEDNGGNEDDRGISDDANGGLPVPETPSKRGRAKNQSKDKGKEKRKEKSKAKDARREAGLPDRDCVVM